MESHATFDSYTIKYAKISLKVRVRLFLEETAARHVSFGERLARVQDG